MNMVGTPYSDVQRSSWTAWSTASGSKAGQGTIMAAPVAEHARLPITIPKQW